MDDGFEHALAPHADHDAPSARSGKWMLFSTPIHHEAVWTTIKEATEAGRLGYAAKTISPSDPSYRHRRGLPTYVYTYDYDDHDDVRRVLAALRDLGFTGTLSYKSNADTRAGVYGEGASMYVSKPGSLDFDDRRET
jgi:hypothetical protein